MDDEDALDLGRMPVERAVVEARGGALPGRWQGRPLVVDPQTDPDIDLAQLRDLHVCLAREDGAPLGWDPDDKRHVVAWVLDADTGERLPFQPWQGFGGYGPRVDDDAREVWLPVRWISTGLDELPPGPHLVTATVISVNLTTPSTPIVLT